MLSSSNLSDSTWQCSQFEQTPKKVKAKNSCYFKYNNIVPKLNLNINFRMIDHVATFVFHVPPNSPQINSYKTSDCVSKHCVTKLIYKIQKHDNILVT